MRAGQDDATDRALAWLPWLFLIYLAFVVYGSLVPLDFQPMPLAL